MAAKGSGYDRINIYLDDPGLRARVKIAAARQGVTVSAFCVEAIRRSLAELGESAEPEELTATAAARALDEIRARVGRLGMPVARLVAEGRIR